MPSRKIDPTQIRADSPDWEVFEVTPHYRRSRLWIDADSYIQKTEWLMEETLIDHNQERLKASEGKKWGDGRVVARIPMNVLYGSENQLAEKVKEGDREHLDWWLNSERAKPWRTFKGKI